MLHFTKDQSIIDMNKIYVKVVNIWCVIYLSIGAKNSSVLSTYTNLAWFESHFQLFVMHLYFSVLWTQLFADGISIIIFCWF